MNRQLLHIGRGAKDVGDEQALHISGQQQADVHQHCPMADPSQSFDLKNLRPQRSLKGVIALVDAVALRRQCTMALLRSHLRAPLRVFSTASDLLEAAQNANAPSCVLFWTGSSSVVEEPWRSDVSRLRKLLTATPLIILADRARLEDVVVAFRQGARGYILTSQEPRLAVDALRMVVAGSTYFPAEVLIGGSANPASSAAQPPPLQTVDADAPPAIRLAPKQIEVLRAIANGRTNKEISRQLMMEEATVKMHVRQIMRRLAVANRTQAALLAHRHGLCGPPGEAFPVEGRRQPVARG